MADPNIDTDQIIPARFLTTTTREGLGRHAFTDRRHDAEGKPLADAPFNRAEDRGAQILVGGHNFGCGSSREHAPWALMDLGVRAVVSTQLADIFRSNSVRNGLLPVIVDAPTHAWLVAHPGARVTIDLEATTISATTSGGAGLAATPFTIDGFARRCLLDGVDEMGYLLAQDPKIAAYERTHTA